MRFPTIPCLLMWAVLVSIGPGPLRAEHQASDFFRHVLKDQKQIWGFPLQGESWREPTLWIFSAASASSLALDGQPSRSLRLEESLFRFNAAMDSTGSVIVLHALPLAFVAAGNLSRNAELAEFGWKSAEAVLDAVIVANVLKLSTQRARPHTGKEYGFFEGGNSFPSGHSVVAWAIAGTAARQFKNKKWVPWVVIPAAALMSFSRISSGHHFVSDAVVGSLLGFSIGYWVAD